MNACGRLYGQLIQKHEAWGHPVVIEGWSLRPSYVHSLTGDVSGVFLLAGEALIEKRVRSSDFSEGASNVALMISGFAKEVVGTMRISR